MAAINYTPEQVKLIAAYNKSYADQAAAAHAVVMAEGRVGERELRHLNIHAAVAGRVHFLARRDMWLAGV